MKRISDYQYRTINRDTNNPTISVCMAVYNSRDYLPRSIDSVLHQTYEKLEIILVDDGSTDGSGDICDEYALLDSRIKVIHKENGGLYTSRNVGIEAATGEYICFMDGDDYIDPEMYESMLLAILENDADMSICRYRQVFVDETIDKSTGAVFLFEKREILEQYLKEDETFLIQNSAWNKLYKRSLLEELRFPARWYEDMLFTPKLLSMPEKTVYIDKAFHNYICDRSTSIMNMGVNPRVFTDLIPNLYDRTAYLESIGEHELALISDYFLYKKLLLYSTAVYRGKSEDKKERLKEIDTYLKAGADKYEEIFSTAFAKPNEYKKLKIYLKSPFLYHIVMRINDSVIIPLKVMMR